MNVFDQGRLRQIQQIIVALQVFFPIFEAFAAKRGLVQLALLDHGAHRPVENEDALAKKRFDVAHLYLPSVIRNEEDGAIIILRTWETGNQNTSLTSSGAADTMTESRR